MNGDVVIYSPESRGEYYVILLREVVFRFLLRRDLFLCDQLVTNPLEDG